MDAARKAYPNVDMGSSRENCKELSKTTRVSPIGPAPYGDALARACSGGPNSCRRVLQA